MCAPNGVVMVLQLEASLPEFRLCRSDALSVLSHPSVEQKYLKKSSQDQVWCCEPLVPVLWSQKQEDLCQFDASPVHLVSEF